MRVLHVLTNLELAGAQISVASICRGLRAAGLDVHVAFSSNGGRTAGSDRPLIEMLQRADVALHDLPAMRRGIGPLADVRALAALTSLVRRLAPAIVHTHMSKAGVLGRIAAALARTPCRVHTVRGWSFYAAPKLLERFAITAERLVAHKTAMLAVSRSLIADGVANHIGDPASYRLVRSGIELSSFVPDRARSRAALGIAAGTRIVGGVMAFTAAKAPLDFVRVARRVLSVRDDVVFVLAGYGPLEAAMRRDVQLAGIADRVRFLGLREDIGAVYGAMDVLLLTSRWEGVPRVAVEAIAAGVPVVSTDVGGCREVIEHGHTGFIAPAGDLDALATGVLAALDNDRHRQAALAARPMLETHRLSRVIEQHLEVYSELAGPCTS